MGTYLMPFSLHHLFVRNALFLAISFLLSAGVIFGLGVIALLLWRIRKRSVEALKKGIAIFVNKIWW